MWTVSDDNAIIWPVRREAVSITREDKKYISIRSLWFGPSQTPPKLASGGSASSLMGATYDSRCSTADDSVLPRGDGSE